MRRIPALLLAAGLATAPASAVAAPSRDHQSTPSEAVETFSWSTSRGRLGVTVMSLTTELREHFGAPEDRGVLVAHVEPDTPAATAGIEVGDVIVAVEGQQIDAAQDVLAALGSLDKGEHAKIDVVRDRKSRSIEVTLTSDASTSASWSGKRLDEWMRPFLGHHVFGKPFVEPFWFLHWSKLLDQLKEATDQGAPGKDCKRRGRSGVKKAAPRCGHS